MSRQKKREGNSQPSEVEAKSIPLASSDAQYRLMCGDVAEKLAKNFRFRLQIILSLALAGGVIGLSIFALFRWQYSVLKTQIEAEVEGLRVGAANTISRSSDEIRLQATTSIQEAKKSVDRDIEVRLNSENVRKTVENVASAQSQDLLKKMVEPSLARFQKALDEGSSEMTNASQFSDHPCHPPKKSERKWEKNRRTVVIFQETTDAVACRKGN